jgi:hypothetical protein
VLLTDHQLLYALPLDNPAQVFVVTVRWVTVERRKEVSHHFSHNNLESRRYEPRYVNADHRIDGKLSPG